MLGCSCGGRGQLGWVGSGVRLPGSSHHSFGASNVRIMDNQSHMGPSTSSSAELFNWVLSYFGVQEPWSMRGEQEQGISGLFHTNLVLTRVAPLITYWCDILFGEKTKGASTALKKKKVLTAGLSLRPPNVSSSCQVAGQALL